MLHQFSNSREISPNANQDDEVIYSEVKDFRHQLRAMVVVLVEQQFFIGFLFCIVLFYSGNEMHRTVHIISGVVLTKPCRETLLSLCSITVMPLLLQRLSSEYSWEA